MQLLLTPWAGDCVLPPLWGEVLNLGGLGTSDKEQAPVLNEPTQGGSKGQGADLGITALLGDWGA